MLCAWACHHQPVSSDTPTGSHYKGPPVLGLEIIAQIQVVRSVQPLGLDAKHSVLIPVLNQHGHIWVPKSWNNFSRMKHLPMS